MAVTEAATSEREALIIGHLADVMRIEPLEKLRGLCNVKFRVTRLNAKIKAVRGRMDEATYVKNRVMRLRQAVQSQHAKYGAEGSAKNGKLKGDGNEGGPTIERAPSDILRIADRRGPVLEPKPTKASGEPAEERNERHHVAFQAHGSGEAFYGERRIGVHPAIALRASPLDCMNEPLGSGELRQHAVQVGASFHSQSASEVSATSSRISAIEMAGRTRTNKNSSMTKNPMVPVNVAQSQKVG